MRRPSGTRPASAAAVGDAAGPAARSGRFVQTWTSFTSPMHAGADQLDARRRPFAAVPWLPIWVQTPSSWPRLAHQAGLVRRRASAASGSRRACPARIARTAGRGVGVVGRADGDGVDVLGRSSSNSLRIVGELLGLGQLLGLARRGVSSSMSQRATTSHEVAGLVDVARRPCRRRRCRRRGACRWRLDACGRERRARWK